LGRGIGGSFYYSRREASLPEATYLINFARTEY
jgi:hypothetical protein